MNHQIITEIQKNIKKEVKRRKPVSQIELLGAQHHNINSNITQECHKARSEINIRELLHFDDKEFIINAYESILNRYPDKDGLDYYLYKLRERKLDKVNVIIKLRYSKEGLVNKTRIKGFFRVLANRTIYSIPIIGLHLKKARNKHKPLKNK